MRYIAFVTLWLSETDKTYMLVARPLSQYNGFQLSDFAEDFGSSSRHQLFSDVVSWVGHASPCVRRIHRLDDNMSLVHYHFRVPKVLFESCLPVEYTGSRCKVSGYYFSPWQDIKNTLNSESHWLQQIYNKVEPHLPAKVRTTTYLGPKFDRMDKWPGNSDSKIHTLAVINPNLPSPVKKAFETSLAASGKAVASKFELSPQQSSLTLPSGDRYRIATSVGVIAYAIKDSEPELPAEILGVKRALEKVSPSKRAYLKTSGDYRPEGSDPKEYSSSRRSLSQTFSYFPVTGDDDGAASALDSGEISSTSSASNTLAATDQPLSTDFLSALRTKTPKIKRLQQSAVVTKKKILAVRRFKKRHNNQRLTPQARFFNNMQADDVVKAYFKEYLSEELLHEYTHLIGYQFLGEASQKKSNLVIATKHCNSLMMQIEDIVSVLALKGHVITLNVSASLMSNTKKHIEYHIANTISYEIVIDDQYRLCFEFNAKNIIKPPASLQGYIWHCVNSTIENQLSLDEPFMLDNADVENDVSTTAATKPSIALEVTC